MNPSQEPTKEELLDGELSEEELYAIAAGTAVGLNLNVKLGGTKGISLGGSADLAISNGGS